MHGENTWFLKKIEVSNIFSKNNFTKKNYQFQFTKSGAKNLEFSG